MANSNEIYNQMMSIDRELAPLMADQGKAPGFFKEGINKAFDYNMPLLKEGAALEAGAYTLPQELMDQYNSDFGSVFGGASAGARLNSILGRLGNQFGLVDLASGLADQQGARMEDMARSLTDQYGLTLQGYKDRYNMKMPLFQTFKSSEDQAANRASQASLAAASRAQDALNFAKFAAERNAIENIGNNVKGLTAGQQAAQQGAGISSNPSFNLAGGVTLNPKSGVPASPASPQRPVFNIGGGMNLSPR